MTIRRRVQEESPLATCDPKQHQCRCQDNDNDHDLQGRRSIRVASFDIHCLRLRRNADAFESIANITIELECLGYNELHEEILADAKLKTGYYDGFMFGPFLTGEMVKVGGLHDLTPYVQQGGAYDLRWNDMFRFNREHAAVYDNKVVMIPLDGDVLSFFYRKDLFEKYDKQPPKTWEEYTELAKFFHGKVEPLPGSSSNETVTLSGSCVGRKFRCQEEHWIILILSSMTQHTGTKTGFLFDTSNMEPLLGEAFVETIRFTEEQFAYGADNEMEGCFDSTNIAKMNSGQCAMTYGWGDSFTEGAKGPPTSFVSGLIGTAQTPGSPVYLDRLSQKLAQCTGATCSCKGDDAASTNACLNVAPYTAFTGWSGAVSSFSSKYRQDDTTDFFAYASSPEVSLFDTIPNITGGAPFISVDPFRVSHTNAQDWIDAGLPADSVVSYLETIKEQQSDPNAVIDIRIPQTPAFLDELKVVMNEHIIKINEKKLQGLTGDDLFSSEEEKWEVERKLRAKWKALIASYDRENSQNLLEIYQRSLGIYAPTYNNQDLSKIRPVGLTLCCILLVTSLGFACWTFLHRRNNIIKVSQPLFLYTFCFGCFVLGSSIIPLSIDDSTTSVSGASKACMAFPWLVSIGFTTSFAALFSKIWRVVRVMKSSMAMRRVEVKYTDVLGPFVVLLTMNLVLLLVWTILDPMKYERTYSPQTLESVGSCQSSGNVWKYCVSFIFVINFIAIIAANVLAYKGRNIGSDFVESKWIMLCTASIFQVMLIGAPLMALVSENVVASYFVSAILVFVIGESILLFIFLPKLYETKTRTGSSKSSKNVKISMPSVTPSTRERKSAFPSSRDSVEQRESGAQLKDSVVQGEAELGGE